MKHTVKRGETLSGIAKQYGSTVEAIASANGIWNIDLICAGQVLTIPAKSAPEATPVFRALVDCLEAIEKLPEYKTLARLLEGK